MPDIQVDMQLESPTQPLLHQYTQLQPLTGNAIAGRGPAPSNPALTAAAPGGSSQRPFSAEPPAHLSDPVLQFLLRNVRSKNVRQQFSKTPPEDYTDKRTVKIMVGFMEMERLRDSDGELRFGKTGTESWEFKYGFELDSGVFV